MPGCERSEESEKRPSRVAGSGRRTAKEAKNVWSWLRSSFGPGETSFAYFAFFAGLRPVNAPGRAAGAAPKTFLALLAPPVVYEKLGKDHPSADIVWRPGTGPCSMDLLALLLKIASGLAMPSSPSRWRIAVLVSMLEPWPDDGLYRRPVTVQVQPSSSRV